ncbi:MAG: single-stranded-DNA-specific exonuclease RecJ [Gemmataceae bacterium]|nr:single-stranded-DNA-specific exonuclease RecJ [Gemmataceae bacterium]
MLPHDSAAIGRLADALRVPPIVAQLLLNRGVKDPEAARQFLLAPLSDLLAPDALPGVTKAAERIHAAVQDKRKICIYGDYDVDGVTGTSILLQVIRLMGGPVDFYVPHRLEEGYGLNADALRQIAHSGASVVVTVDCGIAALAEADVARQLGLELIVTDHHEFKDRLPDAAVLVHPRLPGTRYPFAGLSGAGVAFKLAWALSVRACGSEKVTPRFRDFLLDAVMLATLGLVADVMPLLGENRVFTRHGLTRMAQTESPGLKALREGASLTDKAPMTAEDIGFRLAPRLNAAGRLGCARLVVELLTTPSTQRATDLVRFLEGQNQQRQQLERRIVAQAREQAETEGQADAPALVLASAEWHAGVIGIVAGRLAEHFARPVLMIALSQEIGAGSGRSIPGFALHEALHTCGDCLLSHGGHAAAAGFKVQSHRIDELRERFCAVAQQRFPNGLPAPILQLDAEVPLSTLTPGLLHDMERLEPFGTANHRPLLLAGGLQIVGEPKRMGHGERHMSFQVRQQGTTLRAVAFGMAERLEELMSAEGKCCLAFRPKINDWNGFRRVELQVADLQAGPRAQLT